MVEPTWMDAAYTPVTSSGRPANRSFTATTISALPRPMPMPIGMVRAIRAPALGAKARRTPPNATSATATVTARTAPMRCASTGAGGAKMPMQSTGMVTSSPATACETP